MSLTYLYNKLENMSSREQYTYIQNVFFTYQIRPKIDIDQIFNDIDGKQSNGKNPLGYLVMHLTLDQLQQLVPEYLRELVGQSTFNLTDDKIMGIIDDVMQGDYEELQINFDTSEMTQVFDFGVAKYSPWSFLKLDRYILIPALFRHLYKFFYVSQVDEETGISHLAHACCNIRMMQLIDEHKCDENCDNCNKIGCKRFGELKRGT